MKRNGLFISWMETKFSQYEKIFHIFFWLVYFGLNVIRWGSFFDDYEYSFHSNLVEFPIHIVLVYLNIYFLLPKLIPNKPFLYLVTLFLVMLAMTFLRIELTYIFVTQEVWLEIPNQVDRYNVNYIVEVFIGELYVVGIITAIKLIIDNSRNMRLNKELHLRNYETEIQLLKSQIQPHFFLNTLNNLYALTLSKSENAPDLIIKLSEVMKYLVYQSKKDKVTLKDEIILINNFLDLEKLRYGNRLKIKINCQDIITDKKISPLILFPFVESAFKNETQNKLGNIDIKISFQKELDKIVFIIENKKLSNFNNDDIEKVLDLNKNGLRITKRRLDLLYNKNYSLEISDTDNFYKLTLKIPFSND